MLQRNRLSDEGDLVRLARVPRLRELNLSFNYLHRIPKECVADRGCVARAAARACFRRSMSHHCPLARLVAAAQLLRVSGVAEPREQLLLVGE